MGAYDQEGAPWWRGRVSLTRQILGLLLLTLAAIFFYAMAAKGMRFFVVESRSMEPTFHGGDRLVGMPAKEYHRGDLVIVRDPIDRKGLLVKRVIAVAGDTVEIKGGAVFVNSVFLSEPYRPEPIEYPLSEYLVPDKEVFVLGDNSNLSVDSHNWAAAFKDSNVVVPGGVQLDSVVAKAFYQYYPLARMRSLHGYPLDDLISSAPARSVVAQALQ